MHAKSAAAENSSVALTAESAPQSPWRVIRVEALPGLRLRVEFADGVTGGVDMADLLQSPRAGVFAALADPALFAQVRLEYGAVTWPGELDLAPDTMYTAIKTHGEWRL